MCITSLIGMTYDAFACHLQGQPVSVADVVFRDASFCTLKCHSCPDGSVEPTRNIVLYAHSKSEGGSQAFGNFTSNV